MSTMRSQIPIILALIVVAVAGQTLIKMGLGKTGVLQMGSVGEVGHALAKIATSPLIMLGLGMYAISSFVWLVVLSKVELSFAFPFVSLTYVLVLIVSLVAFKEPLLANRIVGSLVIVAGVVIVGMR